MCVSWDFWPVLLDTASKKAVLIILEKLHDVKRKKKKEAMKLHFIFLNAGPICFYTCNAMQKRKKGKKALNTYSWLIIYYAN